MATLNKTPRICLPLLLAGVLIITALVVVLKVPIWHQVIGGYVGATLLVGAFILLALAGERKVNKMELNLQIMKSNINATVGDWKAIRLVLENAGYQVEIRPTELSPHVVIIRK